MLHECTAQSVGTHSPQQSPLHSARLDVARHGLRAKHLPPDPPPGRHTCQSTTVLLGKWESKKWRASSPDCPFGRGSARTKGRSAANGHCECGVARAFLRLESFAI